MIVTEFIRKYRHIFFTVIAMIIVYLNILHFAAISCGGNSNWMPWPNTFFGIPSEIENGQNMEPLFRDGKTVGWDGQFYYYISNDLLGVKDTPEHVDASSYRWQRIGLPFCAWFVSKILFLDQVSVACFVLTQFFIVFFATALFVKFLKEQEMSMFYVLPWLFSFGTQITLDNCLPDAAADSFFICALLSFLKNKISWYSLFMTFACLTREGFANIAAVFLLIYLIKKWKLIISRKEKLINLILMVLPGLSIASWIFYLSMHFHVTPAQQAHGILNYPLVDFFKCFKQQILFLINGGDFRNITEAIGLIVYVIVLFLSLDFMYRLRNKSAYFLGMIPYVILLSCFGKTVMEDISGYWKGISALFALLPILMSLSKDISKKKKILCVSVLLIELVLSVCLYSHRGADFYPQGFAHAHQGFDNKAEPTVLDGKIIINNIQQNNFKMLPLQKYFFYKKSATLNLTIMNNTDKTWHQLDNEQNQYGVYIQGLWFEGDKLVKADPLYQLSENIMPGQYLNMDMQIIIPGDKQYTYKLQLIQRRNDEKKIMLEDTISSNMIK